MQLLYCWSDPVRHAFCLSARKLCVLEYGFYYRQSWWHRLPFKTACHFLFCFPCAYGLHNCNSKFQSEISDSECLPQAEYFQKVLGKIVLQLPSIRIRKSIYFQHIIPFLFCLLWLVVIGNGSYFDDRNMRLYVLQNITLSYYLKHGLRGMLCPVTFSHCYRTSKWGIQC